MTRAEAKWAIANPETLKAMADGEVIEARRLTPPGNWEVILSEAYGVSYSEFEFRKKPDPAPANEPKRWLIWSIKNHAWWREKRNGYSKERKLAGRYGFKEASEIVEFSNQHGQDTPSSAMIEDPDHEPQTKTP